ncbi:hypothetical protein [Lactiplantibacillus modestisalitolerans]|uniref:Integral membrane protein n=1 Tax=Lactiplantibacillus modestisalitolerans TaxID=1457219 RepID=A0ABV5WWE7_9LACO|nr:hypothetical protein [Lactiplantibacillus modestisalitolerans]
MNKLHDSSLDFSVATLNFLANVGVVLPYVLLLFKYQQTQQTNYLVAIVVFYVARAASVFWTKHLNLRASRYLLLCLWLGVLGSLLFSFTSVLPVVIIAAICLGYTSANIWPYYLTIKLHLSNSTDFKLKQFYWLIFLGLGLLFGIDFWLDLQYRLTFIILAVLFITALPAGKLLDQFALAFYAEHQPAKRQPVKAWRILVFILFFTALGLLTLLRKVSIDIALPYVLGIIVVAIGLLTLEIMADWHAITLNKLRLVNRGFLLSLILLVNSFLAYFVYGNKGMYLVFALYLLGFEGGRPLLQRLAHHHDDQATRLAQIVLLVGHVLILTIQPILYGLGLFLIACYIGFENPAINDSVYAAEKDDPDLAIIHKYRFSMYGGLLCQLCFFGLLTTVSKLQHLQLLRFFSPTSMAHATTYQMGLAWPLVGLSLVITLMTLASQRSTK